MAKMTIRQWPSSLEVRGTTLLETALKAGVSPIPTPAAQESADRARRASSAVR